MKLFYQTLVGPEEYLPTHTWSFAVFSEKEKVVKSIKRGKRPEAKRETFEILFHCYSLSTTNFPKNMDFNNISFQ